MIVIFIIVCLIIAFLVSIMFLILKKTVGIVNSQTKSYFVNKLQGYDDLIQDKENRLEEIDNLIKDKEKGIKEAEAKENLAGNYVFFCLNISRFFILIICRFFCLNISRFLVFIICRFFYLDICRYFWYNIS